MPTSKKTEAPESEPNMIEWLTRQGYRVTIHADKSVFLQRGAWAERFPTIKHAFRSMNGPKSSLQVRGAA